MIDRKRSRRWLVTRDRRKRHLPACIGEHINSVQRFRTLQVLRRRFHYHAILIVGRINRRDLRLPERQIKCGIDIGGGHAHARGGRPIDDQTHLQALDLLIGIDIGHFGRILQRVLQ